MSQFVKKEETGHVHAQSAAQRITACHVAAASTQAPRRKPTLAICVPRRSNGSCPLLRAQTAQINFLNKPDRMAPVVPCGPEQMVQIKGRDILHLSSVGPQTLAYSLIEEDEEGQSEEKLSCQRDDDTTVPETQNTLVSLNFLSLLPFFHPKLSKPFPMQTNQEKS